MWIDRERKSEIEYWREDGRMFKQEPNRLKAYFEQDKKKGAR